MRIYETARRHPGQGGAVAGSVLLERALGGAATLALAAVGFALALGHYDVGAYLWIEGVLRARDDRARGRAVLAPRRGRCWRRRCRSCALIRLERPIRAAYEGIHAYRDHPGLLFGVFTLTLAVQTVRVLAIWLAGKAVGVDLSPRPYYVMGPLLFLVLLVPFSVNGIAVRESFFVSFLGKLGVGRGQGLRDRLPVLRRDALPVGCPARCCSAGRACAGLHRDAHAANPMAEPSRVVVVTYNALPWVEQALESVRGHETIVVDHGSTDGTLELVRERFPEARVIEQENKGLGGGSNAGMRVASGDWFLLLNSDAWATDGALERLVAFGEAHPEAAVVGPRLRYPDGSLQRSVRGFPTLWRLATEYLFLRKLAPRSRALQRVLRRRLRPRRAAARRSS